MLRIVLAIIFFTVVNTWIAKPHWLGENEFLNGFVNHEIFAILVVALTISLSSVVNAHLSINRLINQLKNSSQELIIKAEETKAEMRSNARMIFYLIFAMLILLLIKGTNTDLNIKAAINGAAMIILSAALLSIYDIYKTIFGLSDLELRIKASQDREEMQ